MRVLIIIPAYNESANIERVVNNLIQNYPQYDYVVVNDGSTDNTAEICQKKGYNLVNLPINLGIGGCVQTGYQYALLHDYDIAVQMDGDGQHTPNQIPKLLASISNDCDTLVIGSRFIKKDGFQSTWIRRVGISVIHHLIKICSGQTVYDTTSGFRACTRNLIYLFSQNYAPDYPEPESIVLAALHGAKILEVPVSMNERIGGKSSITFWKSFYYMIKVSLSLILTTIFQRNKRNLK